MHETAGTWIAATGWVLDGNTIVVTMENDETEEIHCSSHKRAESHCLLEGTVYLNGAAVTKLGEYELDDRNKVGYEEQDVPAVPARRKVFP